MHLILGFWQFIWVWGLGFLIARRFLRDLPYGYYAAAAFALGEITLSYAYFALGMVGRAAFRRTRSTSDRYHNRNDPLLALRTAVSLGIHQEARTTLAGFGRCCRRYPLFLHAGLLRSRTRSRCDLVSPRRSPVLHQTRRLHPTRTLQYALALPDERPLALRVSLYWWATIRLQRFLITAISSRY